jgi:hypothetical protein
MSLPLNRSTSDQSADSYATTILKLSAYSYSTPETTTTEHKGKGSVYNTNIFSNQSPTNYDYSSTSTTTQYVTQTGTGVTYWREADYLCYPNPIDFFEAESELCSRDSSNIEACYLDYRGRFEHDYFLRSLRSSPQPPTAEIASAATSRWFCGLLIQLPKR